MKNVAFRTSLHTMGEPGASTRRTSESTRAGEPTCSRIQHKNALSKLSGSNGSLFASAWTMEKRPVAQGTVAKKRSASAICASWISTPVT